MKIRDEDGRLSREWIRSLPQDAAERIIAVDAAFWEYATGWQTHNDFEVLRDVRTLVQFAKIASQAAVQMGINHEVPIPQGDADDLTRYRKFFIALLPIVNRKLAESAWAEADHYLDLIDTGVDFALDETSLQRAQSLLNDLRTVLVSTTDLSERHRRRLLTRLERLQQELHKTQSDLDHLIGFATECLAVSKTAAQAGQEIAKLGSELLKIALLVKASALGLPAPEFTDLLLPPSTVSREEVVPPDQKDSAVE